MSLYADVVSAPLPQRLARRLLAQAGTADPMMRVEVELRLSQSGLAQMLGASRSKVNAELRRLEQEGLLRLGYRRLYLLDVQRLCALAGPGVMLL